MDHDLDALGLEVEKPARLDHLEALVHEACGVDADLAAHGPLRMSDGLLGGDALKIRAAAERAAGGCKDDPRPRPRLFSRAREALEDRIVLAVDGQKLAT